VERGGEAQPAQNGIISKAGMSLKFDEKRKR